MELSAPLAVPAGPRSSWAALRRLGPYLRPVRLPVGAAAAATLGALLCGLAVPLVTQRIVDGPLSTGDAGAAVRPILLVAALGAAEAALFYARRKLIARPTALVESRMRADLLAHLLRLPVAFHDRWPSGQLLSRAVGDLVVLRKFLAFAALFLVVNSVTVLVGLGVLFLIDPWLALVGLAGAAPLLLVSYFYETRYKVAARATQDEGGHLATLVEETMLGIRVVRAYGQGRGRLAVFRAQAERLRTAELRVVRIMAALSTALLVLPELGIAGQLGLGAVGVANSTLSLGDLVAAVTVSTYLRWPTECIGWALAETSTAAAACDRYWEVRDTPPGLTDPARPRPPVRPARGHLRLEHVEFRYPGAGRPVLRDVSLELRPGETVALVGATGSGKTTLAALVPRLADVTAGRVTVDGVDVRELRLADLRAVVGCAFDDPLLSSLTVRENVTLGAPEATDDAVWEALRVAGAADFVAALGPDGLAVRVGEQGMSLSGGQRQRIALARAIVGRPALLVLDDPLSALDLHTEAEVERALRRVLRRSTALVVAHRPNTARMADRVVLLEDGRITARGTHRELLAASAAYRALMAVDPRPAGETHDDGVVVR
ncbi:ABC transporter ATP-binding protein/permease [Streptomyces sp. LP05-1]|uniref:ABC transporter ATP-binding protein/permease n=1 Tax=Streptomyces pyxinae TaxID=2970734 RepID=A0ABT2CC17_9ACTN|nr:ABC transporter ATP-binding protein [Streptomyces sp. LP05-1]MCS0634948.1 ABC transporter ATP-binding protein/permease [Streptomyces sp. LP05-1]